MTSCVNKVRTNYVHITDIERFKAILQNCITENGTKIEVLESVDSNGQKVYGFAVADDIAGYEVDAQGHVVDQIDGKPEDEDFEISADAYLEDLQSVIATGDALIITTIGYEKIRWLTGEVMILTNDEIMYHNLENIARKSAQKMLNNPEWDTQMYF